MFNSITSAQGVLVLLFCIQLIAASGCGISNRVVTPEHAAQSSEDDTSTSAPVLMSITESPDKLSNVEKQLQKAHHDWKGTPYLLGGKSTTGIDCSAFTQIVFRDYFGREIPRDTRRQLFAGSGVRRKFVQTGDLIFFKTGRKSFHVGIAVGNGDFLHASQSSGVMISSIYERYWATRYFGARRVL